MWDAQNEHWVEGSGADTKCFSEVIEQGIEKIDDSLDVARFEVESGIEKTDQESRGKEIEVRRKLPIIVGGCCRTNPETISALRNCEQICRIIGLVRVMDSTRFYQDCEQICRIIAHYNALKIPST